MDEACGGDKKCMQNLSENLMERDLGVDRRTILKWVLML
jgi:hypothetical protein